MSGLNRRQFLARAALAGGTAFIPGALRADTGDGLDLLIRGGEVLDPSQQLRGRYDVGIRWGRIVRVEPAIPPEAARQVIEANGHLVTPGLIDLHTHVYPLGSALGLPADELAPYTATTTYVSAGDAGANNFGAFKHYMMAASRSRMFAFIHISRMGLAGFPVGETLNIDYADVDAAAKCVAENSDVVLGVKVRISRNVVGDNGLEPLRRAIRAAETSATGARVMCHIGDAPGNLSTLLDMLRPGDVLTHSYSGAGNNIVQNGKLLPAALEAKQRGVTIDVGHGGGSFDYTVAEPAIEQGLTPDTISSDIHALSGNSPGMPYLPWVMSKFLNLGLSLQQVVALATSAPAGVIDRIDKLGTLEVGAPADVSVLELVEEPVEFVDTKNNTRPGTHWLKPLHVVRAGVPFGRPYPMPFTYR
ncbi:MAG TPA: amidohydrolase/deacetylase family metallohydrolase [Burkholderiales bacterium]|nr:amidohydrolase/deacetylase family metallohydrolase [Burkholderiales bacterium]